MTKQTKIISILCCFALLLTAFLLSSKSIGVWHLVHMAIMPDDLHTPIVTDIFEFNEKGYSKEYKLKPKYRDIYAVSVISKNGISPSEIRGDNNYDLEGKFKIELFRNSKKLSEKIIDGFENATFTGNDTKTYKSIGLYSFPIPFESFSTNNMKIKISVIEPDSRLGKYKESIELQIGVSAIP